MNVIMVVRYLNSQIYYDISLESRPGNDFRIVANVKAINVKVETTWYLGRS